MTLFGGSFPSQRRECLGIELDSSTFARRRSPLHRTGWKGDGLDGLFLLAKRETFS
jgi:hypothetical protein